MLWSGFVFVVLSIVLCEATENSAYKRFLTAGSHGGSSSASSYSSSFASCNLTCQHYGRCAIMTDGSKACICSGSHSGLHCEYSQQDLCHGHCYAHGKCVVGHQSGYYHCLCEQHYSGTHCDHHVTNTNNHVDHCNNQCVNGECSGIHMYSDDTWKYICRCHIGWYGDRCDSHVVHHVECGLHLTCYHGHCHRHDGPHYCSCHTGWQGHQCDQLLVTNQPTTTKPTTTSTTTTASTTTVARHTTVSIQNLICSKHSTLTDFVKRNISSNDMASLCTDGSHTAPEAFVLNHCPVIVPTEWTQGEHVMSHCSSIPAFTPIATFTFGSYALDSSSMSAIFIECSGKGIKIIYQLCGHEPQTYIIDRVNSGGRSDPDEYYTIL